MAGTSQSEKVLETVPEERVTQSVHMESISRVMNLPIVKRTAEVVTMVYSKIKDTNPMAKRTLTSAESIVKTAVASTTPLVVTFQKPIEKVDNLLCSGLDYVEKNMPVVKKEPGQINDLINYISETLPVKTLLSIPEYGKQKVINYSLVSKAQEALLELKPYFSLKMYQQNFNIYEFITQKINELFPSRVAKEVTDKNDEESKEPASKEDKTTQKQQPTNEPQSKPEGTTEKAAVVKAS